MIKEREFSEYDEEFKQLKLSRTFRIRLKYSWKVDNNDNFLRYTNVS